MRTQKYEPGVIQEWYVPVTKDEPRIVLFGSELLCSAFDIPEFHLVPEWDCLGPCVYIELGMDVRFYGMHLRFTISHHAHPIDDLPPYWLAIIGHEEVPWLTKVCDSPEQARDWIEETIRRKLAALMRYIGVSPAIHAK